jgi:hypothetical protein
MVLKIREIKGKYAPPAAFIIIKKWKGNCTQRGRRIKL